MAIDVVVEEVADNLNEIAEATRRINTNSVSFFLAGAVVGFGVGAYWGYKRNKESLRAEAFAQSEEEVEQIREEYRAKTIVMEPKPDLETAARAARDEAMREAGYSATEREEHIRPLPAPVPGISEPAPGEFVTTESAAGIWDYGVEVPRRSKSAPYVIHQDEYRDNEGDYTQVTYTYYSVDDVLVDEQNEHPLPHPDLVVGTHNLKFGHGTDDPDVVFVRNDRMELEMEICRLHESYEETLLGVSREDPDVESDDS